MTLKYEFEKKIRQRLTVNNKVREDSHIDFCNAKHQADIGSGGGGGGREGNFDP